MSRDERITLYVSESEKEHLKSEADEADETLSSYVYKLMQSERERRGVDRAATDLSAEERIEALVADATETIEETADDLRKMQARSGVYAVASYELLQNDVLNYSWGDSRAEAAREAGSRRLRIPYEEHEPVRTSDDSNDSNDESESNDSGSGSKGVDDLV